MDPRPGWESYYLGIAHAVAARGECTRRQVGAVIVHHHSIIATGYNGAPPGWTSCLDGGCPRADSDATPGSGYADSKCVAIHAEMNAIVRAGRERCLGATLYTTHEPCEMCMPLVHASGLYAVVWGSPDEHQTRYTGAKVVGTVG
ncbi:MAG: dCMP deaminase [Actinomycetota bacterium]|nr:dCMP deaminase [Actinomycetota bacterium]HQZ85890.1 deaminase [Actinomycetota bacterium]